MIAKIKSLSKDEFIKNNIVFFAGSMIVAVLNYLYHPILGRMLSVEDFGEVQSLISLSMQLGVFGGVFSMIAINVVANYEDREERDLVISTLKKIFLYINGTMFVVIVLMSTMLEDFFQFSSPYPFISLGILLLTGVSIIFRKAFLQGISDFKATSWVSIIQAAGKLLFAVIFVYFGFRSLGAISGLVVAQGLAMAYVYYKTKKRLNLSIFVKNRVKDLIKKEYKYALLILLATSAVTFLYTADVLMVKHWFSPEEAGLYSGIATIARIIIFASGSVSAVLVSAVRIKNTGEENRKILKKGLAMTLLISCGGFLVFSLFSKLVITTLIGVRYIESSSLLGELSFLLLLVSVINLLFFYFLALRRTIIFAASLAGPIVIVLLSFFRHESLLQIIHNFIFGSVVVLVVLFFGIYRKK